MQDFLGLPIVSLIILIVGCIDDLKTRKIHNQLILWMIPIALISVLAIEGPKALIFISLFSGLTALGLALPLYFLGIIGGGDVKLYFAVSLTFLPVEAFWALVWGFPIGLVFGLLRTVFQGKIKDFGHNMLALIQLKKPKKTELQTFPFAVALLLGWMTFRVLSGVQ